MYNRNISQELLKWKKDSNRKPLILRGARLVGKTSAIKQFSLSYENYIYINLEKKQEAELFQNYQTIETLISSVFFLNNINIDQKANTLLFIDEIQEVPEAINLLRYFFEDYPELHVIAAGSLLETILHENISIPVGRVEFKVLRPVCFEEFLGAMGETSALEQYHRLPIAEFSHQKMLQLFNTYALIGGMPEIVKSYSENKNLSLLQPIFESLLIAYQNDFEKYARNSSQTQILRHILKSLGAEAANRIKFQHFGNSNYGSREIGEALRTLEKAMILQLVYPITSTAFPIIIDFKKSPKLQLLDTGLLNQMAGIQKELIQAVSVENVYHGKVAEHIVGQELLTLNFSAMNYLKFWTRENKDANAEVDFVVEFENLLIPVEVKLGATGRLRSLHAFMDLAPHAVAVRVYSGKLAVEKARTIKGKDFTLINLPFYLVGKILDYIRYYS
jgi:predicted AAA+ superfamily ATPase